jgi:hypothetical protein
MTGCAGCRVVALDGRTFRVDGRAGYYWELVSAPLDTFEPGEPRAWLEGRKVARYAALYRGGSLFPPVAALGFTGDHGRLTVPDGNHRPAAARLAGAPQQQARLCPAATRCTPSCASPGRTRSRSWTQPVGPARRDPTLRRQRDHRQALRPLCLQSALPHRYMRLIEPLGQRRVGRSPVLFCGNETGPDQRLVVWVVPIENPE